MDKIYKVEIVKNTDGASSTAEWRNTYHVEETPEMAAGDAGGVGIASNALQADVLALVAGEVSLHTTQVRILRAVITTPEVGDSDDPNSVRIIPVGQLGIRPGQVGDEMLPLESVLKVSFAPRVGRSGANQYRGALWQSEVELKSGSYHLKADLTQRIQDKFLGPIDASPVRQQLRIARVEGGAVVGRTVARISVLGISNRQRTQRKRSTHPTTARTAARNATADVERLEKSLNALNLYLRVAPPTSPLFITYDAIKAVLARLNPVAP